MVKEDMAPQPVITDIACKQLTAQACHAATPAAVPAPLAGVAVTPYDAVLADALDQACQVGCASV